MYIEYELPDYWVEGADKLECDSTVDCVFDDLIIIN